MIICVNEPSAGAYYGGVVAKPIGERIFRSIFEIKALSPTDESQLSNKPTIEMPNVEGLSITQACAELKILGLNAMFDGEGNINTLIANLLSSGYNKSQILYNGRPLTDTFHKNLEIVSFLFGS